MVKEGYKQTEIGLIPEDWEVKSFNQIAIISRGASPRPIQSPIWFNEHSKIGWVRISDVTKSGKYLLQTEQKLSILGVEKSRFVESNNLIMSICATLGRPIITSFDVCIHDGFVVFKDLSIEQNYMYYYLKYIQKKWTESGQVGTQVNLNTDLINNTKIPIPSKEEQKAIAKALSDTDELITLLEKLISKKEAIKQGAMQQILTSKKRLNGFSGEWEEKSLEEVANISRGASPRPIEDPKWFDNNSDIGWVRISDISKTTKFLNQTVQKLSQEGVSHSRFVKKENLIMSICATLGKPILTRVDTCIHDGFVVFNNLQIDREFLYYFLFFIEKDWSKSGQTGSQMNLNTELINSTTILLPPAIEEQQAIAKILSDMDNEIESLKLKLAKTKAIKDGMMSELLTGKIRLV